VTLFWIDSACCFEKKKIIPGLLLEPSLIITSFHELGEGNRKCKYHIYKEIFGKVASWIIWEGWGLEGFTTDCIPREICCDLNLSGLTFILGGYVITHSISNHASMICQISFNKFSSKKFALKLFHMLKTVFILMYCNSPGWNTSHTLLP